MDIDKISEYIEQELNDRYWQLVDRFFDDLHKILKPEQKNLLSNEMLKKYYLKFKVKLCTEKSQEPTGSELPSNSRISACQTGLEVPSNSSGACRTVQDELI